MNQLAKSISKLFVLSMGLFLFAACNASSSVTQNGDDAVASRDTGAPITVVYSTNNDGEVDPCG